MRIEKKIESTQIKQVMQAFFTNAAPIFCCRPGSKRDSMVENLLDLTLDVFGAAKHRELCLQIIQETNALRSAADARFLDMGELPIPSEFLCYFDMKAAALRQPGLPQAESLDIALLQQTLRQAGAEGQAWAIRTGACMNWLAQDRWSSRDNALRMWKMLAFSGDLFAMRALEHHQQSTQWRDVHRLCELANNQYLTILPQQLPQEVSKETAQLAQLIIFIRSSLRDTGGHLPMAMLQYAAESQDSMQQKLQALCAEQDAFALKLVQEQKRAEAKFGF